MPLLECTVQYVHISNNVDTPSSVSVSTVPLIGEVLFWPQFERDAALSALGILGAASGVTARPFSGFIDDDGVMKNRRGGTPGVRIWANDPRLGLNRFRYKVTFDLRDPMGRPVRVAPCYLNAPDWDTNVDLARFLTRPHLPPLSLGDVFGTELDGGVPNDSFDDDDLDGGGA